MAGSGSALPFIIEIDGGGRLVQIADTRHMDGKRAVAQRFLVPQAAKRTVGVVANLLWDNVEYALGVPVRGHPGRVMRQHRAFRDAITDRFGVDLDDEGLKAVNRFLGSSPRPALESQPVWPDLATNPFVSFRLAGAMDLICRRPDVASIIDAGVAVPDGRCLVTGEPAPIARLHPSIKGIRGTNTSGGSLISFNLEAFESYGLKQGDNGPVGTPAAFAYTTALNELLLVSRRSLAGSTIVYWAQRSDATALEAAFAQVIEEPKRDDPLAGTQALEAVLGSVRSGIPITADDDSRFFVLALAPNAARISVRSALVTTVRTLAKAIARHFDDIDVVRPPHAAPYSSLSRLLDATAPQGKSDNVPPNLAGELIQAVLNDRPYPTTLLHAAVRRARVAARERYDPLPLLAAVIKGSVNRLVRASQAPPTWKELTVALNPDNPNPAYRLGRLFALLERAQEIASGGNLNATIRDRFYGAASASPVTVFSRLLTLKNHHVAKFDRPGDRIFIERSLGEVMSGIDSFPAHLTLAEQGLFAVGYLPPAPGTVHEAHAAGEQDMNPIEHRYDFVLLFDVKDGNPNGDPDAGNLPRLDAETGHGIVTDVSLKRKVRNFVDMVKGEAPFEIYIKERAILNQQHERAYVGIKREDALVGDGKKRKGGDAVAEARDWMCANFYDVRAFGAVMSTGVNAGQVRGPIQMTFGRSVEPIVATEHAIPIQLVGQPEVAQQGELRSVKENVVGLDIAVEEASVVTGAKPDQRLPDPAHDGVGWEPERAPARSRRSSILRYAFHGPTASSRLAASEA